MFASVNWKRRFLDAAAWGSLGFGLVMIGLTIGRAWFGRPYAIPRVVYVEKPMAHLFGGLAGLFGWYVFRRGYRNSARDWARFAAKLTLLTFSLALSLFAGEIGYRLWLHRQKESNSFERFREMKKSGKRFEVRSTHPMAMIIQPSEDRRLVYELESNLDVEFGHKRVRTNRDGMRDALDYPVERRPNSVRIVGLGDSGMFGWNVEQDETYMAVLETILNQRGDGVLYEALNLAVPGYNTQLESEMLRVKGLKYRPDIVVVGWCANDYQLPFFLLEDVAPTRHDKSFLYTWLFARTNLENLVGGYRMTDLRSYNPEAVTTNLVAGSDIQGVRQAMAQIKSQCESAGARLLVFGPMDPHVTEICKELRIPYYNTLERIRPDEYPPEWSVHFMHPRAEGHRVLGERLVQELDRLGWLKPRT